MSKNRFRGDYQLIEDADEKGRLRTTYRYTGPDFLFEAPADQVALLRKRLPVLSVISWIFWFLGMGWFSNAMRFTPAALAYAFDALPLALFTNCCFVLRGLKEPMENRHADRMNNRYPAAVFFLIVCSVLSILGGAAAWIRKGLVLPGDLLYMAGAAQLLLTGVYAYRRKNTLRIRKADL